MLKPILKMNFNFNFKDMPGAPRASIRRVTNARDRHHTGKFGIKRVLQCESCDGDIATGADQSGTLTSVFCRSVIP